MEKKTVKYHIPQHGIYMYARTNSGKTELIVLNSTTAEQVVANNHYRITVSYTHLLAVWAPITYAHEKGYAHLEFMDAGLPFKKQDVYKRQSIINVKSVSAGE